MKKVFVSLITLLLICQCGFTASPTPSPDPNSVQSDSLGPWEITLDDHYFTDSISIDDFMSFTADEGNQYLVIDLTVSNTGKQAETFLPSFYFDTDMKAKLYYDEDYEFSASRLLGLTDDLHDQFFNPLITKSGFIVFALPESIIDDEKPLQLTFSMGDESFSFDVRQSSVMSETLENAEESAILTDDTDKSSYS